MPPGRYFLRAPALASWFVQSISINGRDVTDAPFVVERTDIADVIVTYADRPSEITGRVESLDGSADSEATIFVFPEDRSRWADARVSTRSFQAVRASRTGAFNTALAPGDYLVLAMRENAATDWPDPAWLTKLAAQATRVRLAAGQKAVAALKTVRPQ